MSLDLHDCARRGDLIHLQLIFSSKSAGVNQRERATRATCLHYAVLEQHLELVEMLLNFGADTNQADREGRTPLHCAVSKQADPEAALQIAQMLLHFGADPTLKAKDGETILHQAAREGHLELMNYLLDERKGELDLDCRNDRDETPLYFAAGNSHTQAVLELLHRGANPNIPNQKGRTPLHMALRWAKSDTKKIIERHAAMAPTIEHITLPSGTVIRKDLLPESFNDVMTQLQAQKAATLTSLEASASPEYSTAASGTEANGSFAAQVHLLGGRSARQSHLSASPVRSVPQHLSDHYGVPSNAKSSSAWRRESVRLAPLQLQDEMSPPPRGGSVGATSVSASPKSEKRSDSSRRPAPESDRLAEKERLRVDQRLRGLFYAGMQRARETGEKKPDVDPHDEIESPSRTLDFTTVAASREATQKEEELTQLTAEIKSLKEAGFKDPAKEMRRLDRENKRKSRSERKAQREREREDEAGTTSMDDDVIGEHTAALLAAGVPNVIPAESAFTLRSIVNPDTSGYRGGLYGVINGLETRLKSMSGMYSELEKYVLVLTLMEQNCWGQKTSV